MTLQHSKRINIAKLFVTCNSLTNETRQLEQKLTNFQQQVIHKLVEDVLRFHPNIKTRRRGAYRKFDKSNPYNEIEIMEVVNHWDDKIVRGVYGSEDEDIYEFYADRDRNGKLIALTKDKYLSIVKETEDKLTSFYDRIYEQLEIVVTSFDKIQIL